MNLNEVIRFAPLAINCFTGSLAQLSRRGGVLINEAQLLEASDGYLCTAQASMSGACPNTPSRLRTSGFVFARH